MALLDSLKQFATPASPEHARGSFGKLQHAQKSFRRLFIPLLAGTILAQDAHAGPLQKETRSNQENRIGVIPLTSAKILAWAGEKGLVEQLPNIQAPEEDSQNKKQSKKSRKRRKVRINDVEEVSPPEKPVIAMRPDRVVDLVPENVERILTLNHGKKDPPIGASISPDDKWVITWGDNSVKFWNNLGNEFPVESFKAPVQAVKWTEDGKTCIVSTGKPATRTYLLNPEKNFDDQSGDFPLRHSVPAITFHNGQVICIQNELEIRDPGKEVKEEERKKFNFKAEKPKHYLTTSIAVNPNGEEMITTDSNKNIRIWDMQTRELQLIILGGGDSNATYNPTGDIFATTWKVGGDSSTEVIVLWNKDGKVLGQMDYKGFAHEITFTSPTEIIQTRSSSNSDSGESTSSIWKLTKDGDSILLVELQKSSSPIRSTHIKGNDLFFMTTDTQKVTKDDRRDKESTYEPTGTVTLWKKSLQTK